MLCIISPYAAVYAHGAHRVGRHGARGKHLRHSCDLWAWWCCLRCYCWLGCQWRDGRRPLAPLQHRLLGDGKIQSICGCRTMARTCVTSFCVRWRARGAEPSLSRTHRGWVWRTASDLGASGVLQACTTPIVRRREKSSISEIRRSFFLCFAKDERETSARRARSARVDVPPGNSAQWATQAQAPPSSPRPA